jgi:hypothetical protein
MTKSRFDPDLEAHEDPDEAVLADFWEGFRKAEETGVLPEEPSRPEKQENLSS